MTDETRTATTVAASGGLPPVPPMAQAPTPPVAPMVDISDFDTKVACERGFDLELVSPVDKRPLGVFIPLVGRDAEVVLDHVRERVNTNTRKHAMLAGKGISPPPTTVQEQEAKEVELLAVAVMSAGRPWRTGEEPVLLMSGQRLDFNAKNVIAVLTSLLWIRRQVDAAMGDLENFIKA